MSGFSAVAAGAFMPAAATPALAAPKVVGKAAGKPTRIDVHRHIVPPGYRANPDSPLADLNARATPARALEDMDRGGVALSVISVIVPEARFTDEAAGRAFAREVNEFAARLVADHPGRFGHFAYVPYPDVDGSLKEIEYALDVLKADGVFMFTTYGKTYFGDPVMAPVFEELNRRGTVVYTHPRRNACCSGLVPGMRDSDIEFGTDTTRAIARTVFSGSSRRYPDMRVIWSHAGGTMPYLARRFIKRVKDSPEFQPILPEGFLPEARKFYYDVAQSPDRSAMISLKTVIPVSQILFGTDYPYQTAEEHVVGLKNSGVFNDRELRAIGRDNALRLLPNLRVA